MASSFRGIRRMLAATGAALLFAFSASAWAQFSITVTLDENCNGRLTNSAGFDQALQCGLFADPGPGGLASALTYDMLNPPALVAGDLILLESDAVGAPISDIIRFNTSSPLTTGAGSIVFYSDNFDGIDAQADTGFPTLLYTNVLTLVETGAEGQNGYVYTPTRDQPGFVAGAGGPVTYVIRSDTPTVPEPATLALLGTGLAAAAWGRRRKA